MSRPSQLALIAVVYALGTVIAVARRSSLDVAGVVAGLVVLPLLAWGTFRYTRLELPLPAVLAMVLLAIVQVLAWGWVAGVV